MYRKEVNAQSPLRILEKSIHGGLGKGNLGVVMAPAGVGKTACLVQIGLDDLMREKDVLHAAVGQSIEYVNAWYDALFDDLAAQTGLEEKEAVRTSIGQHRVIKTFADGSLTPARLDEALELFGRHMGFKPQAILVDGFDWSQQNLPTVLQALKATARRVGAELWLTAPTPRGFSVQQPASVMPPCDGCAALIDVGLYLEPHGSYVSLRLVKDHGDAQPPETHLELHCDTLRLVAEGEVPAPRPVPAAGHTLLSGAAPGAEQQFGACAEEWGLSEINYSFHGRQPARTRGLVELSDEELARGDVSSAYLKAHMHRVYPQTPLFKRVLQSIWHQVNTAGEVFSVGQVLPDKTVKGGTGWAVELALHWGKPVHVYDQEQRCWFGWIDRDWKKVEAPRITRERFAGTGTRFLTDDGKQAIRELFERSFEKTGK